MGQKTEADWEGFKQSWNKMGGEAWTNEVNEQYASITHVMCAPLPVRTLTDSTKRGAAAFSRRSSAFQTYILP